LTTVALAEEVGGLGLPLLDCCVIAEELAAGCSGLNGPIEASTLAQLVVSAGESSAQTKEWLASLTGSPNLAGIQSNLFCEQTTIAASKTGGSFVLDGAAIVANAESCQWFLVAATINGARAIFVVDKDSPAVTILERVPTVGRKALSQSYLRLDKLKVNAEALVCQCDSAAYLSAVQKAFCLIGAGAVGLAVSAMKHAVQYARERKTFGQPIYQHQGVAFMLADMAKDIQGARLLVWQAALTVDAGRSMVPYMVALANAQEIAMRVTTDAVQVYGGYGYSKEYPVEKLMRDAKAYQVYQDTNLMLKARIGKELVRQ
jgi:acyl-CoA dehydrogenase